MMSLLKNWNNDSMDVLMFLFCSMIWRRTYPGQAHEKLKAAIACYFDTDDR